MKKKNLPVDTIALHPSMFCHTARGLIPDHNGGLNVLGGGGVKEMVSAEAKIFW